MYQVFESCEGIISMNMILSIVYGTRSVDPGKDLWEVWIENCSIKTCIGGFVLSFACCVLRYIKNKLLVSSTIKEVILLLNNVLLNFHLKSPEQQNLNSTSHKTHL